MIMLGVFTKFWPEKITSRDGCFLPKPEGKCRLKEEDEGECGERVGMELPKDVEGAEKEKRGKWGG